MPRSPTSYEKENKKRSRSRSRSRSPRRRERRRDDEDRRRGETTDRKPIKYKYWDVPPIGYENMRPAEYKALLTSGQIPRATIQSSVPVVGPSVTCQSRRLYIGGIPFGCTEDILMDFFNQQLFRLFG
uniref:RRM domain-containing protein n=1 Tax=Panagrolaimus sp. PS1159 TaxID=55785 RepID=A0AC35GCB5_9BILA